MQFKHPELLYALLLLIIPIIVHLFQLRRFQKVPFTNVQFLKNVILQTRKSSRLKKWLILCTRLLLLAAIIIAFAQPYWSNLQSASVETETVIYLDNSFSMQAKGDKGELLKRAAQDIISTLDESDKITVFTNSSVFINTSKKSLTNDLLQLEYSSTQLDYEAVVLKGKRLFKKEGASLKNLVLLSDFQQQDKDFSIDSDSLVSINLVPLRPVSPNNISVDSLYISKTNANTTEITVILKQHGNTADDISISLFSDDNLIAKTSVNQSNGFEGILTVPSGEELNGKITIEDGQLSFDNTLYFNISQRSKINVLSINSADDNFLKRVYSKDEFNYTAVDLSQLNYNDINAQDLIVLNEIDNIPLALINVLNAFIENGNYILIIPSEDITIPSYNQLFTKFGNIKIDSLNNTEKKLTEINFSHPIYSDVFDATVSNFQYPKVNMFYELASNGSSILKFEDGKSFLLQNNGLFVFTAALNLENSNFINSPLIVPTLYNIGRQSLQLPILYYTIGKENKFDINTAMQQDDILKIEANGSEIIPLQRTFSNKVTITTNETPEIASTYAITNNSEVLEYISYNYDRKESNLSYMDLSNISNAKLNNSIPQVINTIKSTANVNELWKWFVIFALMLLIIEMLILKYFK